MNTQRPIIHPDHVQAALDTLVYTSTPERPNPLWALTAVDEIISTPDFPSTSLARPLALQQLLTSLIADGLALRRNSRGLPTPSSSVNAHEAKAALKRDANETPELAGWSLLYYRYVCAHLNLSQNDVKSAIHADLRTARRYQSFAVTQLTQQLAEIEWEARVQFRRRRLYSQLPTISAVRLVGREQYIREITEYFKISRWRHVYVTGAPGIGKTLFVQECVRTLIDNDQVMQVIWVDHPASPKHIWQRLHEQLIPEGVAVDVRNYTLSYPIAIVLDALDSVTFSSEVLSSMLYELSAAVVFVVMETYIAIKSAHSHIALSELSFEDTVLLVDALTSGDTRLHEISPSSLGQFIWEQVGGHPLAVTLLVRNLDFVHSVSSTRNGVLNQFYSARYQSLSDVQKRGLWMLALIAPGDVSLELLTHLWSVQTHQISFNQLVNERFIDLKVSDSTQFILPESVRKFLLDQMKTEPVTQSIINVLLVELDVQLQRENPLAQDVVAYVLENGLPLPDALRRRWVHLLCSRGTPLTRAAEWRGLLEKTLHTSQSTLDIDLQLAYAVCLRRLGEWSEAHRILHESAIQVGRRGAFDLQAKLFLELSVIARYRGDYTRALALIMQAESAAHRFEQGNLLREVRLERVQIALDQELGDAALDVLRDMPATLRVMAMRAEATFFMGDHSRAKHQIQMILSGNAPFDATTEGRLYTILGRIKERERDWMGAYYHFGMAHRLFEQTGDIFALGRILANLSVVAIEQKFYEEALALLTAAEKSQLLLGDKLALAVTRHNLSILNIRQSSSLPDA